MSKIDLTLFPGEPLPEFTDRLGFVLMEFGVRFRVKEFHDDYITFELSVAETLDEQK